VATCKDQTVALRNADIKCVQLVVMKSRNMQKPLTSSPSRQQLSNHVVTAGTKYSWCYGLVAYT
jgi:hypothetical protein